MSGFVLWWRCGVCLTAIVTEGQSRAAEGVHTAMPCCDFFKIAINPRFEIKKEQPSLFLFLVGSP